MKVDLKRPGFGWGWIVMPFVPLLLVGILATTPVYAGGVVGTGTPGSCTEAALDAALVGGGTVTFACGGAKTIRLTFYKQIADDTTIDGGGLITLSGNGGTYLFQVYNAKALTLKNITLADGSSNVTGAIENFGMTTIVNSQLVNNQSSNSGGAIVNYGTLDLTNSTLWDNHAASGGGAIYNDGGQLTLTDVTVSDNTAGAAGGGISNHGNLIRLNRVTVSRNTAAGNGGGIYSNGTAELTNVTLSGNQAMGTNGGGGMYQNDGNATLNYVTVADNSATYGAGLYKDGSSTGDMELRSSLLSNNTTGNCDGVIKSAGYNLSSDSHCSSFTQPGDEQGAALPLGPLANNGGPTLTHMPASGNPAIDGSECVVGIAVDQRGSPRPFGSACDVGAVEVGVSVSRVYLPLILR
jgi:predicted outer membrane repeat protein